jgi:hypothetical protein
MQVWHNTWLLKNLHHLQMQSRKPGGIILLLKLKWTEKRIIPLQHKNTELSAKLKLKALKQPKFYVINHFYVHSDKYAVLHK